MICGSHSESSPIDKVCVKGHTVFKRNYIAKPNLYNVSTHKRYSFGVSGTYMYNKMVKKINNYNGLLKYLLI